MAAKPKRQGPGQCLAPLVARREGGVMAQVLSMSAHRRATGSAEPPEGSVYIGRAWPWRPYHLPASKWRNPWIEGRDGTLDEVIARSRVWLCDDPQRMAEAKAELRGRDLYCWCAPGPCHGDVLLEVANS